MRKRLIFFVHDCFFEVGHTKAMIEVMRRFPFDQIEGIEIVSFQCDPIDKLFPDLEEKEKIKFHQVPFPKIKPFIFKVIFYQIYCLFYLLFKSKKEDLSISIGVCAFGAKIINIQFAHFLWEKEYFKHNPRFSLKGFYKTFLLKYLTWSEIVNYKLSKRKFVFLSKFIGDEVKAYFNISDDQSLVSYSSVDTEKFSPPSDWDRNAAINQLAKKHPEIKDLDWQRPVALFVGAFERKGLPRAVEELEHFNEEVQLIIVGKPEAHSNFSLPQKKNFLHISFSYDIDLFYKACDAFIFPTYFEPFGLVVLEAAASGMELLITQKDVGASELLSDMSAVHFIEEKIPFEKIHILSPEERLKYANQRNLFFSQVSWENASNKWWSFITEDHS